MILKRCLIVATNIVQNNDIEKYVYSGYGIASDGKYSSNFESDFARML